MAAPNNIYANSNSSDEDLSTLPRARPNKRPSTVQVDANLEFVDLSPEWTTAGHISQHADYYKPVYRPALLPQDAAHNPRREALPFGIHPEVSIPNILGRSMMTPVDPTFPDIVDIELEEAYQAMVLEGFTTSELVGAGAYNPDGQFPPSDLAGDIHPVFRRDKWTQDKWVRFDSTIGGAVTTPRGVGKDNPTVRYNIGNKAGEFNAATNDELWALLQPALRLATKIMQVHPVWEALLNIYHFKPVPLSSDSRTPEQLQADNFIPRTSFWRKQVDVRQMYLSVQNIHATGHVWDRFVFEDYLTRCVVFKFMSRLNMEDAEDGKHPMQARGLTMTYMHVGPDAANPLIPRFEIRISADNMWPLLVDSISTGEKMAVTVHLAATLLHELAHAAVDAVRCGTIFPQHLRDRDLEPLSGFLQGQLSAFSLELGLGWDPVSNYAGKAISDTTEFFFEDEVQNEEGMAVENVVFGGILSPPTDQNHAYLHPYGVSLLRSWPQPPEELKVDGWKGAYAYKAYIAYLKDPPAPTWITISPVPLADTNAFLQQGFWDGFVAKYGAPALRRQTTAGLTKMTFAFRASSLGMGFDLVRAFSSMEAATHIGNGLNYLYTNGAPMLQRYLYALTLSGTEARRFKQHLHYTKKTWPKTDNAIGTVAGQIQMQFTALTTVGWQRATDADVQAFSQRADSMVADVLELVRLLQVEILHSQHLAHGFFRHSVADRAVVGNGFMTALFQRWTTILLPLVDFLGIVLAWTEPSDATRLGLSGQASFMVVTVNEMLTQLTNTLTALQPVAATLRNHVIEICTAIQNGINGQLPPDSPSLQADIFAIIPKASRIPDVYANTTNLALRRLAIQELANMDSDSTLAGLARGMLISIATVKDVKHQAEYVMEAAERIRVGRANLAADQDVIDASADLLNRFLASGG